MRHAIAMYDDRGFSLLEVLVATTIMTVAVAALAQVLALGTALNASAARMTFAAVLASQQVESLRSLNWDALRRQTGRSVEYLDRTGALVPDPEGASFTRESIVETRGEDPANLVAVQVIVRTAREAVTLDTTLARHER